MHGELIERNSKFLDHIVKDLEITSSKFKQAMDRKESIENYLKQMIGEPDVYIQGSFRLGTVVRPIREGKENDYDMDLVCQLPFSKKNKKPKEIKDIVGSKLKEKEPYRSLLKKEGKRCWTLQYAEEDGIGFHVDILPSIGADEELVEAFRQVSDNSELSKFAISLTKTEDFENYDWSPSNPRGYAGWFNSRKKQILEEISLREKGEIYFNNKDIYSNLQDVPDSLVKTPLQKAIMILKRHRDLRFSKIPTEKYKPISIIITTLAARLYNNEPDTYSALQSIVTKLNAHNLLLNYGSIKDPELAGMKLIERIDGKWWVRNPVKRDENFADKWDENNNARANAFFKWLEWVQSDLLQTLESVDLVDTGNALKSVFGATIIERALKSIAPAAPAIITQSSPKPFREVKPWSNNEC